MKNKSLQRSSDELTANCESTIQDLVIEIENLEEDVSRLEYREQDLKQRIRELEDEVSELQNNQ